MRRKIFCCALAIALAAVLMAVPAQAQGLTDYSQDFEGLVQSDPGALTGDGWLVFGNVFNPGGGYLYGYGPFPAPNGGPGFSGIDVGQGGPAQGAQQLVVYNDYNNGDHANGNLIEANVFQEQTIGAADVGNTWLFEFDAKRGNIAGTTTANAFFKTLDPNNGFALTNFIWVDMTNVPTTWDRYSLSIFIDPSLDGQILQFGYLSKTTFFQPSGIFYDNINFRRQPLGVSFDVKPGSCPNPLNTRAVAVVPTAILGSADLDVFDIDVSSLQIDGAAPVNWSYEDVAGPYLGDLCGCTEAGPDGFLDLTLKFATSDVIDSLGYIRAGDQLVTVEGALLDGTPIEGQDCVFFVGGAGRGGKGLAPGYAEPVDQQMAEPSTDLDFQSVMPTGSR